jgi:hypothetical protein
MKKPKPLLYIKEGYTTISKSKMIGIRKHSSGEK